MLANALKQSGLWEKQDLAVNASWLIEQLTVRIQQINWPQARQDVSRFIKSHQQATLDLWSTEYFLARLEKLSNTLKQLALS